MPRSDIVHLFADGGVIGRNPSSVGGTWAWVGLDAGFNKVDSASGVVLAKDGVTQVTNNQTELVAAVTALHAVGKGWSGTLYTDSQVTLYRVTDGMGFENIDNLLRLKALDIRRNRKYRVVLLQGHPTKKELEAGVGRSGRPVSEWNVWCDKACGEAGRKYLDILEG